MAKQKNAVAPTQTPLNAEQAKIAEWLRKLRFRRVLFGGVSEANVWRRIGELNEQYERALAAERIRYDALLEERMKQLRDADGRESADVPEARGRPEDMPERGADRSTGDERGDGAR